MDEWEYLGFASQEEFDKDTERIESEINSGKLKL